ncbi:BRO-N domain-containing protein [Rodentibacter pneumotropicus]|uniref:BRO-N domain-containing protein n=1 Tax=Rodentibacter pneumotropicus TaxID=758 RepID=UPI000986A569|nr:Bro-N domain-containing protein [Rodentibacter pneumotropicus]OOF62020.1 antirepressor [Rodentibacter pneumotropicus]THA19000.1 hypothetical protein D3M83_02575 [Rodentibacter pneumotropicus]
MSQSTQISTFNFESNSIRTLAINNEPWFVAKDLCDAINISNYRDAIERLDEDEKGVALTDTLGGKQEMNIVSESGMYTLILRCRDAVKKGSIPHRFRKWVTAEVLPQIRKTGSYTLQNTQLNLPLTQVQADEEALQIIVNLYHSLREAHEFAVLAHDVDHRWLKQNIDKDLGGHLLHNLNRPAKNALDKAKKYIHAKSERIMFVKGMLSLLEAPKTKRVVNF